MQLEFWRQQKGKKSFGGGGCLFLRNVKSQELEVREVAGVEGGGGEYRISLSCQPDGAAVLRALALPATPSLGNESLEGGVAEAACSAHRASGSIPQKRTGRRKS